MPLKLTSIGRLIHETGCSLRDVERLAARVGAEPHEVRDGVPYFSEDAAERIRAAADDTTPAHAHAAPCP